MGSQWSGGGTRFALDWGGQSWVLDFTQPGPSLVLEGEAARILGLGTVSDRPRSDPAAFTPATLVAVEQHADRIEAAFRPVGWGGMFIKALWRLTAANSIDLTIHLQADSVDELHAVEVGVFSQLTASARCLDLEPQANEPETTVLPELPLPMTSVRGHQFESGACYLEFCNGHDLSRRAVTDSDQSRRVDYHLFGHALEKGVVIRGRLRGLWLPSVPDPVQVHALWREFRNEPLPLGI